MVNGSCSLGKAGSVIRFKDPLAPALSIEIWRDEEVPLGKKKLLKVVVNLIKFTL
jgi:hypothetical protein